jgi:hypothetical protein
MDMRRLTLRAQPRSGGFGQATAKTVTLFTKTLF